MAKISPIASKYIVHTSIRIEGMVDRPDVIGAIFGQTEGLLGNDLELRELQRSGKIGRIEVKLKTKSGKTEGEIIIPSSLDKTETAIVGAALEIIQRIGPCNAKLEVQSIEDVRVSKRRFVIDRAKKLLSELTENTLPDTQELTAEVAESVRMMEIKTYGKDKLPAGPAIEESEEVIVVEGRADVLVLLKHGFKNAIAMNGTSVPKTIIELSKKKTMVAFVDGDRGGNLIIRELMNVADIDAVCKAPDGKEVEDLAKKEVHKALRSRITAEQARHELGVTNKGELIDKDKPLVKPMLREGRSRDRNSRNDKNSRRNGRKDQRTNSNNRREKTSEREEKAAPLSAKEKEVFKSTLDDLFGTRGACIFDNGLKVLGKVPLSELSSTIRSLKGGVYAVALDGTVDAELVDQAQRSGVKVIVGKDSKTRGTPKTQVISGSNL